MFDREANKIGRCTICRGNQNLFVLLRRIESRSNQCVQIDQFARWPTWSANTEHCEKIKRSGKTKL